MANPTADYPGALHTNVDVSGFSGTGLGATSPTHTSLEGKQEEELVATQRKLGTGSSAVAPLHGFLVGSPAGVTLWTQQPQVNKTLTFTSEYDAGDLSGTTTINWNNGQKQTGVVTASGTVSFTAPPGVGNLLLRLVNTGSPVNPITWPGTVNWPSGTAPTLTLGSPTEDIITFYYNGTSYYGAATLDFR